MKKVFIAMAMLFMPLASMAMTLLTDEELSAVTSQAGVSIAPDITMNISIGVIAWGDSDGLEVSPFNPWGLDTAGGYIGITDLHMDNVRVRLRTDDHYNGYDPATMCRPATIDVGTRTVNGTDRAYVRIGTGALAVTMDSMHYAVGLGPNP